MKKYLNTLYLTSKGTYIHKERETIIVEIEKKKAAQFPLHTIGNIYCFGQVMVSPALMGFCGEKGVGLAFFTWYGKFLARVAGPVSGNVLLRRTQYRFADDQSKCLDFSKNVIGAKVASTRASLQRHLRNYPETERKKEITEAIEIKKRNLKRVKVADNIGRVRGLEGEAAHAYFSVLNDLIVKQKEDFIISHRNRRPPKDNVNAMLSFVYTLIEHDCISACEGVGLDPSVGFLHRDRPGRYSLALDFLEEFRSFIGDRLVLSLINRGQVRKNDFETTESGAVRMGERARKTILTAYQDRKKSEMEHPFFKEKAPVGLFFHFQAQLLARHLRGDIDFYPPFYWRS